MAVAVDSKRIVELSMVLRASSPDAWRAFLDAMDKYASDVSKLMLGVDMAMLPKAQGMALQAAEIAEILKTAPEVFEAAQQKRHANNVANRTRPG